MKKLLFLILLSVVIFSGCKLPSYTIGMNETQFKSQNKWTANLVEASAERTVYRIPDTAMPGQPVTYMYYYFVDGKLVRIDQGERQPTVIIEHVGR
ncbi:hypothetical protein FFF34_003200 [Inquilinus sp. KBS0705]|nr:hypothetical protein FFF34_003200 [Inquilinus sp. KBS0705]